MLRITAVFVLLGVLGCGEGLKYNNYLKRTCMLNSTNLALKEFYSTYISGWGFDNEFPCGYRVTTLECGEGTIVDVTAVSSWNKEEYPYISSFTVNITTTNHNGTQTHQVNTLTEDGIKKFMQNSANGDTSPWQWSFSGCRPAPGDYIKGQFNRASRTGVLEKGGVKVTFESVNKTLLVTCTDDHFDVIASIPDAYCGGKGADRAEFKFETKEVPAGDSHHTKIVYEDGYMALAKQKVPQPTPLCREASAIVTSECPRLGDVMYECHRVFEYRRLGFYFTLKKWLEKYENYGYCMATNGIDRFKVYVTCLRVLCGTEGATSQETCDTLQQVADTCQNIRANVHMNIRVLQEKANCSLPVTTPAPSTTPVPEPLSLGAACTEKAECGTNTECTGTPKQCSCKAGFNSNNGRNCGRLVGRRCSEDADCVTNAVCKKRKCSCKENWDVNSKKFCVRFVEERCFEDSDCVKNSHCVNDVCTCRSGYHPTDGNYQIKCKLQPGSKCDGVSECGINSECTGTPSRCTCKPGYVNQHGRCGKRLGDACTARSECGLNTWCGEYRKPKVCVCYPPAVPFEGECVLEEPTLCVYESQKGALKKYYKSELFNPTHNYDAFNCRLKLANIQCGDVQAEVTVDHGLEDPVFFKVKWYQRSSRGLYVKKIDVNITTTNKDGSVMSQTNHLDTDKLQRYVKKENFKRSPWKWNYTGSTKPRRKHRIVGIYNQTSKMAEIKKGGLFISYSKDDGKVLTIQCLEREFRRLGDPYETICGGPGDSDKPLDAEILSKGKVDPHHVPAAVHVDYIALTKQNAKQINPLCLEAKEVLTGECTSLGESMFDCRGFKATWYHITGCIRKKGMETLEVYLACMRVRCGGDAARMQKNCNVLQKVYDECGDGNGHITVSELLALGNCTTTTTTVTP